MLPDSRPLTPDYCTARSADPERILWGTRCFRNRDGVLPQSRADLRQMMPTVTEGMVFDHELRGDGRSEAQAKRRRLIQLLIRKLTHLAGGAATVAAQERDRLSLVYIHEFARVMCVH